MSTFVCFPISSYKNSRMIIHRGFIFVFFLWTNDKWNKPPCTQNVFLHMAIQILGNKAPRFGHPTDGTGIDFFLQNSESWVSVKRGEYCFMTEPAKLGLHLMISQSWQNCYNSSSCKIPPGRTSHSPGKWGKLQLWLRYGIVWNIASVDVTYIE